MFQHRARPDTPPLDEATAERLFAGVPIDDAPDAHRRVAELLAIVSRPATPDELEGAAAAAAEFVTAHDAANQPAHRTRPVVALAISIVLFAFFTGTAFAATEGALPEPAQAVAHEALGVVGISVPGITPQHPEPAVTGPTTPDVHPMATSNDGNDGIDTIVPEAATSRTSSTDLAGGTSSTPDDKATTPSDRTTEPGDVRHGHTTDDPRGPTRADTPGPGDPKNDKPAPKPTPEAKPVQEPKPKPEPEDLKGPTKP